MYVHQKFLVTAFGVMTIFLPCNKTMLVRSHPKFRFKLALLRTTAEEACLPTTLRKYG